MSMRPMHCPRCGSLVFDGEGCSNANCPNPPAHSTLNGIPVTFPASSHLYSLEEVERMTTAILTDLAKEGTWDEEGLETAQAAYDILKRRLQHHTGEQGGEVR